MHPHLFLSSYYALLIRFSDLLEMRTSSPQMLQPSFMGKFSSYKTFQRSKFGKKYHNNRSLESKRNCTTDGTWPVNEVFSNLAYWRYSYTHTMLYFAEKLDVTYCFLLVLLVRECIMVRVCHKYGKVCIYHRKLYKYY